MLILKNISYIHPDKEPLFRNINFTLPAPVKAALVGKNGVGKSTLLKIIAGELPVAEGQLTVAPDLYYVPQIAGQYNHLTVAEALKVNKKLEALHRILKGETSEANFAELDDDWTIEERCTEALKYWQEEHITLTQKLSSLSGGQKTKVFLAGIFIHHPRLLLLDEPSNHLDSAGRALLYQYISTINSPVLAVSHDRALLNLFDNILELDKEGITVYGGNYDFYKAQKEAKTDSLNHELKNREKDLRKAKIKEKEIMERQQKLDSRGKSKKASEGVARIMMNTLRNKAEKSTSKIKDAHGEKISNIKEDLKSLRAALPGNEKMTFQFDHSVLYKGRTLFSAQGINYNYGNGALWKETLDIHINSGDRLVIGGTNGSGKTTLVKIILGIMEPSEGECFRAGDSNILYLDQDYSIIDNDLTVSDQAQRYNTEGLEDSEIKSRLSRFLFTKDSWHKRCSMLSGGERMRLVICCMNIQNRPPDILVLDEPTNNLDLKNTGILTTAVNEYKGTLIVISHDSHFVKEVNIQKTILLQSNAQVLKVK